MFSQAAATTAPLCAGERGEGLLCGGVCVCMRGGWMDVCVCVSGWVDGCVCVVCVSGWVGGGGCKRGERMEGLQRTESSVSTSTLSPPSQLTVMPG